MPKGMFTFTKARYMQGRHRGAPYRFAIQLPGVTSNTSTSLPP